MLLFPSNQPQRITMIAPSLGPGGAERSLVLLANEFQSRGFIVTVLTYHPHVADCYDLAPEVGRRSLDLGPNQVSFFGRGKGFFKRLFLLRKTLVETSPDVIISFLERTNELVLLATMLWTVIKVASFQNDLRSHRVDGFLGKFLRAISYPFAHRIVFLDEDQATWCAKNHFFWSTSGIPNPVAPPAIDGKAPFNPQELTGKPKNLVAMGRLVHQKGFDLLLDTFAQIASTHKDWGLIILGEGEKRQDLHEQIERRGLAQQVFMPGVVKEPSRILKLCDLFVFSSRYEGQGMALIEAMTCGLPVVSFDCDSGPRMIVRQGVDGLLVEKGNVTELALALDRLMRNDELRRQMGSRAKEVEAKYSVSSIVDRWIGLLVDLKLKRATD